MKETYKKRNVAVAYSGIQGCYYMNGAAILGFTSVYLLDNGVSNTEIGLIYGIAGLIAAILQTIIAGYADEAEAVSVKILLIWSNFLAVGFDILLFPFITDGQWEVRGCMAVL